MAGLYNILKVRDMKDHGKASIKYLFRVKEMKGMECNATNDPWAGVCS